MSIPTSLISLFPVARLHLLQPFFAALDQ